MAKVTEPHVSRKKIFLKNKIKMVTALLLIINTNGPFLDTIIRITVAICIFYVLPRELHAVLHSTPLLASLIHAAMI